MPTFSFKNKITGEEIEQFMSLSERDDFLSSGEWIQTINVAPSIGDPVHLGVRRTDDNFNDALKQIGKRNNTLRNQSKVRVR